MNIQILGEMYDHFDLSDPLDSKFLSDMFVVQKEYKLAFSDSGVLASIEQCVRKL